MKTKINLLVSVICKMEGKKVQVSAGNVRELLAVMKKISQDPAYFKIITEYLVGK